MVARAAIAEVDNRHLAAVVVVATVAVVAGTGYSFVVAVAVASLHSLDSWVVVA